MPSRVIHIRLDDWVLLGCHDVMKEGKESIDNIPMATIVRNVLTALIRKLQNTNQIPTYTKEEAYARAMEMYGGAEELDLNIVLADIVNPTVEDDSSEMEDLLKETLKEIENEGAPVELGQKVEISEAERIEVEKITLNLLQVASIDFDVLKNQSPKDRFIEWAVDQPEVVQKAVCITYDGLPRQLWGSEKAEKMIKDLLEKHVED